jgi:hypothetical protein
MSAIAATGVRGPGNGIVNSKGLFGIFGIDGALDQRRGRLPHQPPRLVAERFKGAVDGVVGKLRQCCIERHDEVMLEVGSAATFQRRHTE